MNAVSLVNFYDTYRAGNVETQGATKTALSMAGIGRPS